MLNMAQHVTMPCGWGCGAVLTSRQIREHFAVCPNRGQNGSGVSVATTITDRPTISDAAEVRRLMAIPVATQPIPDPSERVAGLKTLLRKIEERVGMGDHDVQAVPRPNVAANDRGEFILPIPETPYERNENRRAWSAQFLKLRQLGQYDEAGAAEQFSELVKGHQLPQGFMKWPEPKKLVWLVENVVLED